MSGLALIRAGVAAAAFSLIAATPAAAQSIELRVHHFLPASSTTQARFIDPWCKSVAEQSGGRLTCKVYPSMQLGGAPPQLVDQVRDGVVDVVWTLPSYTPGRFPKMSVFELPFMVSDSIATSRAAQLFYETHARDEFAGVHPIVFHVHERGSVHTRGKPIRSIDDFRGLVLRAPSREVGEGLARLGASPVFMPVPQVPEAMVKGVIDGAVVPWEVTTSLRLGEIATDHVEFPGERGLYTAVFAFLMNQRTYDGLPADLRAVVDANSGVAVAEAAGRAWVTAERDARAATAARGNSIHVLPVEEVERARVLARPVIEAWVAARDAERLDGAALLDAAETLIEDNAPAGR